MQAGRKSRDKILLTKYIVFIGFQGKDISIGIKMFVVWGILCISSGGKHLPTCNYFILT